MKLVAVLLPALMALTGSEGQSSCQTQTTLQPGQSVTVTSPGYPDRYSPGSNCSWTFLTNGTGRPVVDCDLVGVPESSSGCVDFLVYGTGDGVPSGSRCGTQGFQYESPTNRLALSLVSDPSKIVGGKFSCRVTLKLAALTGRLIYTSGCDCGTSPYEARIVGGTVTKVNEFPFMAGIVSSEENDLICGGTIISQNYVVTAAHCVFSRSESTLAVLVGDWDTSTGSDTSAAKLIKASFVIVNEAYDPRTQVNDIALVSTVEPIPFSALVNAVCLPWKVNQGIDHVGYEVLAVGWGTVDFGGARSSRLKKVSVNSIDKVYCEDTYPDKFSYSTQLCTYSPNGDACQFDSGGPILYLDPIPNRYFLVGIISYGRGCADGYPSVNTKVYSYLEWIYSYTSNEPYCSK